MDTNALLDDLAQHYEKSQGVLAQIELSLRDRSLSTYRPARRQEDDGAAEPEETTVAKAEADEDDFDVLPERISRRLSFKQATDWLPGPQAGIASHSSTNASSRRVPVTDLSSGTPTFRRRCPPRRAASLFSLAATPSSPLGRRNAPDTDWHQQQAQPQQTPLGPLDVAVRSAAGAYGSSTAIMHRFSAEQAARARQRAVPERLKSPLPNSISSSLPDIGGQPQRGMQSQPLQLLRNSASQPLLREPLQDNFFSDADADLPNLMQPPPRLQPASISGCGEDSGGAGAVSPAWRRSMARRGSDYMFSPLRANSFTGVPRTQMMQQPLASSPISTAASGTLSPSHSLSSSLPAMGGVSLSAQVGGGYSFRSGQRSSVTNVLGLRSNTGLKPLPSPMLIVEPDAIADPVLLADYAQMDPDPISPASELVVVVAPGRGSPFVQAAAAGGTAAAAGPGAGNRFSLFGGAVTVTGAVAAGGSSPREQTGGGERKPLGSVNLPRVDVRSIIHRARSQLSMRFVELSESGGGGGVTVGSPTAAGRRGSGPARTPLPYGRSD